MRVYVVKDGVHTLKNGRPAHYTVDYDRFSKRYLAGFEDVVIVGRLFNVETQDASPVDGPGVSFMAIPSYRGPWQFILKSYQIIRVIWKMTHRGNAYILRLPQAIPCIMGAVLVLKRIPFCIEMVGDAGDTYSSSSLKSNLAVFWERFFTVVVKFLTTRAVAVSYVTKEALQQKFPASKSAVTEHYTSLDLKAEFIVSRPRDLEQFSKPVMNVISVGMMHNGIKGFDLLIRAIGICKERGYKVSLTLVGEGELRPTYEKMATDLGIRDQVRFTGKLSTLEAIIKELDRAAIFALASYQEGLPRAMIEACARALPTLGTDVGGTKELILPRCLLSPGDVQTFAGKIIERIEHPGLLVEESISNLKTANDYEVNAVQSRRERFYNVVRKLSC